jgi:DNA polymerase-4
MAVVTTGSDKERCILHVDMDAFYASVEQRDNTEFRRNPVLVGGTGPRGVVAACSYEARKFGIHSAMPMAEAIRRCPQAICVRPRMSHYKDVSRHIFSVFAEFTPEIEGLSLDEAYLDVTASLSLFGTPRELGQEIKIRIREATGLTASVGVASNKLLAKIASDLEKPDGLCELMGNKIRSTLDPLPVKTIGGIGTRTAERLKAVGIHTLEQLRLAPDQDLRRVFGRYTDRMRLRASGIDERPVCTHRADQSISGEETFDTDIGERARLVAVLKEQTQRVCERMAKKDLQAAVVAIKIRRGDFSTFTRQRHVTPPVTDQDTMNRVAVDLLDTWLLDNPGVRLRLLGVGGSGFSPATQLKLFDNAPTGSELGNTVESIRTRFGDDALVKGADTAIQRRHR